MTLLWSWANTFLLKESSCINTLKLLKGSSPHWHEEDRGLLLPETKISKETQLASCPKDCCGCWTTVARSGHVRWMSCAGYCWVHLIKGKKLETRMGSRNRNPGCNLSILFFVKGKNMTVWLEIWKHSYLKNLSKQATDQNTPNISLSWKWNLSYSHPQSLGFLKILVGLTLWKCTSWYAPSSSIFQDFGLLVSAFQVIS